MPPTTTRERDKNMIVTYDCPKLPAHDLRTLYYMGLNPTEFYPTGATRLEFFPERAQGFSAMPEAADVDVNTIARIARDVKCKVTINYEE